MFSEYEIKLLSSLEGGDETLSNLNRVTKKYTAFKTFNQLLRAENYIPSLNIAIDDLRRLRNAYNALQRQRLNWKTVCEYYKKESIELDSCGYVHIINGY